MTFESPSIVQADHLSRGAYLYVRQSTLRQVAENTESTRRQYALRERAEALGWPTEQIQVIDCDQGISGAGAADRLGFQQLVTEVSMGRVGIVLGLEVSRLARNCSDWHRLVELCAMTGTLILDQDGLYDPTTFNHQLVLGIKGFMSAVELGILRGRLRAGLLAKAARGELRTKLPVGFVYDESEQVCLHPDAQVRQSIQLLFETFRRTGTAGATVKYFTDESLLFPRSDGHGTSTAEVQWKPLMLSTVVRILHNPRYAGAFAYGRQRSERRPDKGTRTKRAPREQWHALVRDAHPGYIDWDEFERNEQQLRRSALAYGIENRRSPPREGPALLQGLVLCGVCGRRMSVRYHERSGGLVPDYQCMTGRLERRQGACQVIVGDSIDRAVGERLVAAMTPKAIEITLAVRAQLQARLDDADRLRLMQVERALQEAQLARRRYMQIDPDNRLVAGTLEADWNDKLRALAKARDEAERQRATDRATLDQATEERIRALAEDFEMVWNDPATSHRDRKRMARLLIEDVTLLKSDKLHVHIRFKGGTTESLVLPRPRNAWHRRLTHPDTVARVEQLLEQHEDQEVAERLDAEGLRTGAGKPFDAEAVRWLRQAYGLKSQAQHLRETGKLTIREMAAQLGTCEGTVRKWAREGRLNGIRHGRKTVWLLDPPQEQPAEIRKLAARVAERAAARPPRRDTLPPALLKRIQELLLDGHCNLAVAERLDAEGWTTRSGAPFSSITVSNLKRHHGLETLWEHLREAGKLTSSEMAISLGIGLKTVSTWARTGRLRGRRCGNGIRARWMFDPIDEQPQPVRQLAAARSTMGERRGRLSDAAAGRGAV